MTTKPPTAERQNDCCPWPCRRYRGHPRTRIADWLARRDRQVTPEPPKAQQRAPLSNGPDTDWRWLADGATSTRARGLFLAADQLSRAGYQITVTNDHDAPCVLTAELGPKQWQIFISASAGPAWRFNLYRDRFGASDVVLLICLVETQADKWHTYLIPTDQISGQQVTLCIRGPHPVVYQGWARRYLINSNAPLVLPDGRKVGRNGR